MKIFRNCLQRSRWGRNSKERHHLSNRRTAMYWRHGKNCIRSKHLRRLHTGSWNTPPSHWQLKSAPMRLRNDRKSFISYGDSQTACEWVRNGSDRVRCEENRVRWSSGCVQKFELLRKATDGSYPTIPAEVDRCYGTDKQTWIINF